MARVIFTRAICFSAPAGQCFALFLPRTRRWTMKILAVTGGGQGIGRAIAFRFAQNGYAVWISDTDEKAGNEACERTRALGAEAMFVRADIARERDVENWLARTVATLGCPDVLV